MITIKKNPLLFYFFKIVVTKYTLSNITYIVISTLWIVAFYNIPNILYKIALNYHNHITYFHAITDTVAEVFLVIAIMFLFLGIFSFSNLLLKFWVSILIIASSIFTYYIFVYNIFIDELFIDTIVKTNLLEVKSVISIYFIIYLIIFTIIPLLFFTYKIKILAYKNWWNLSKSYLQIIALIIFVLLLAILLNNKLYVQELYSDYQHVKYATKSSLSFYTPLNYIAASTQYYIKINTLKYNNIENISKKNPFVFTNSNIKNADINIVLVIGESSRADHQSLNGYKRNTNPYLSKINNLISFKNVYSCDTYSVSSINCLLSSKNEENFSMNLKESNLISAFNSLGFDSYFLTTQSIYNDLNYMYFAIRDSQTQILNNKIRSKVPTGSYIYDEYILNYTKNIKKASPKHKLIIIYLTGSHTPYYSRYPKRFQKFKPDRAKHWSKRNLINSYDNTIVYTDYVLAKLIKQYKGENTLLYYVSDHGESLGENGKYLHGAKYDTAPVQQKHVTQFIWVSDKMINLLGKKYNNIEKNKNKTITHDYVFHSLFNCLDIESNLVKKELSICN